jgi:hypothetical protein
MLEFLVEGGRMLKHEEDEVGERVDLKKNQRKRNMGGKLMEDRTKRGSMKTRFLHPSLKPCQAMSHKI